MFSDIVQRFETGLNALYKERDARRTRGQPIIDMVSGNVNRAGFIFPPAVLKQAFARGLEQSKIYAPEPLGQKPAREAISRYYRKEGLRILPGHILLTPGTSVSYHYLFSLLANPGDEILCPTPSYPLLDSIAELSRVRLTKYRLLERKRWEIDLDHLAAQITPRTRGIVLISPHNPSGAVATAEEVDGLVKIAQARGLPIISDEVFSEFVFQKMPLARPGFRAAPLVFTLNGVSKMFALPGLKIGWIGLTGPRAAVQKAVHALDMISDNFLPVNEAAQFALPVIFAKGSKFLAHFQKEIKRRRDAIAGVFGKISGLSFNLPEGGFYFTLRLTEGMDEEKVALDLLKHGGVFIHPGYFYDLEGSHLVVSLVEGKSRTGQAALRRLRSRFVALNPPIGPASGTYLERIRPRIAGSA